MEQVLFFTVNSSINRDGYSGGAHGRGVIGLQDEIYGYIGSETSLRDFRLHANWSNSRQRPSLSGPEGNLYQQNTIASWLCANAYKQCAKASWLCTIAYKQCANVSWLCTIAYKQCANVSWLCPIAYKQCANVSWLCPIDAGLFTMDIYQWTLVRLPTTTTGLPAKSLHGGKNTARSHGIDLFFMFYLNKLYYEQKVA